MNFQLLNAYFDALSITVFQSCCVDFLFSPIEVLDRE